MENYIQIEIVNTIFYFAALIILSIILLKGKRYFKGGLCLIKKQLSGKIIIITGCNTGIGKETAQILAAMNATVIFACRNKNKTLLVLDQIEKETNNKNLHFIELDLNDLNSVRLFVDEFKKKFNSLDILINNAGVANSRYLETIQGFEQHFGINYLGHSLLTILLLPFLKKTLKSRIVNVSSEAHKIINNRIDLESINKKSFFSCFLAVNKNYAISKLFQIQFSQYLQRILEKDDEVKVVSLHPGVVRTEIIFDFIDNNKFVKLLLYLIQPFFDYFTKGPLEGAQTTLFCSLVEWENLQPGRYYKDCQLAKPSKLSHDIEFQQKLWNFTERVLEQQTQEQN